MKYKIFIVEERLGRNYRLAAAEYIKRLSRFCKVEYAEVKNAGAIKNSRYDKSYRLLLSPSGESLSSEELAQKINAYAVGSVGEIWVVAAPAEREAGLNEELTFHERICLSSMELGAGLACAVFCEALYRAYKILHNEPYHR